MCAIQRPIGTRDCLAGNWWPLTGFLSFSFSISQNVLSFFSLSLLGLVTKMSAGRIWKRKRKKRKKKKRHSSFFFFLCCADWQVSGRCAKLEKECSKRSQQEPMMGAEGPIIHHHHHHDQTPPNSLAWYGAMHRQTRGCPSCKRASTSHEIGRERETRLIHHIVAIVDVNEFTTR